MHFPEAVAEDAEGLYCSAGIRQDTSIYGDSEVSSGSSGVCRMEFNRELGLYADWQIVG